MRHFQHRLLLLVFASISGFVSAKAQYTTVPYYPPYLDDLGAPTYAVKESVPGLPGYVNVANGNLHLQFPLYSTTERGGKSFVANLVYDSRIWRYVDNGTSYFWSADNAGWSSVVDEGLSGWRVITNGFAFGLGPVAYDYVAYSCTSGGVPYYWTSYTNYRFQDLDGTTRRFPLYFETSNTVPCQPTSQVTTSGPALDASGYWMNVNSSGIPSQVIAPDGTTAWELTGSTLYTYGYFNGNTEDANGNITGSTMTLGAYPTASVVDTLNRPIMQYSTNSSSRPYNFTFPIPYGNETLSFGPSAMVLPDGETYEFSYVSGGSYPEGEMSSMTLPTGGTVSFGYGLYSDYDLGSFDGMYNSGITSVATGGGTWTYTEAAGGSGCICNQVTVQRPSGDQTVYTFTLDSTTSNGAWNTLAKYYTGSASTGELLKTVAHTYDMSLADPVTSGASAFVRPTSTTTTYPGPSGGSSTLVSQSQFDYEPSFTYNYQGTNYSGIRSNVVAERDYAYGSGGVGSLMRQQCFSYLHYVNSSCPNPSPSPNSASAYIGANIINRVTDSQIWNASGTKLAETMTTYDSTTLTSITGVTQHDDTNYGTSNTVRGNPTVVQSWTGGSSYLTTTNYYDMTGQVVKSVDPAGNQMLLSYTDNYYSQPTYMTTSLSAYSPTPPTTNAFVTTKTLPVSGAVHYGYYYLDGKQAVYTDQNSQSAYTFYEDTLDRPTATLMPAGGTISGGYPSANEVDYSTASFSSSTTLDGLARPNQGCFTNDPQGTSCGATTYDTSGRKFEVYNPTRSGDSSTPYGVVSYYYDGLNRVVLTSLQDYGGVYQYYGRDVATDTGFSPAVGRSSQLCSSGTYGLGYPSMTLDEGLATSGRMHQTWTDSLGRLIEVDEPESDSGGNTQSLTLATCYQYDLLGNLTTVVQGAQTRSFVYDPLSRLTSEATPEAGTVTYSYTASGGGLCAGSSKALCYTTDARGITTTYTYDAENRLTGKSYYPLGEPSVGYFYDQSSYSGLTITNGKGRRTGMSDASGQTAWSFDPDGNMLTEQRTITSVTPSVTESMSYTYTGDDQLQNIVYPGDSSGDLEISISSYGSKMYQVECLTMAYNAASPSSSPACDTSAGTPAYFAFNAQYAPHGALKSLGLGAGGSIWGVGSGGIGMTNTFNNRLQPLESKTTWLNGSTPVSLNDVSYSFTQSTQTLVCCDDDDNPYYATWNWNNGLVAQVSNNLHASRTQNYTYDWLNRLSTAQSQSTSGSTDCWAQVYTYDRWANLSSIQWPSSGWSSCTAPMSTLSLVVSSSTNQVSGYTYDSSGNVTYDGTYTYTWNAEGRMATATVSGTTTTYSYDGMGRRVSKSGGSGKLYWYGPHGEVLAESDGSGNILSEYIYFNGQKLARFEPSNSGSAVYYYVNDRLGSAKQIVSISIGGALNGCNSTTPTGCIVAESDYYPYGGERVITADSTSNTYKYTGDERDAETGLDHTDNRQYASTTGRWLAPDPTSGSCDSPQSWNAYAYVKGDPIDFTDPDGLEPCGQLVNGAVGLSIQTIMTTNNDLGYLAQAIWDEAGPLRSSDIANPTNFQVEQLYIGTALMNRNDIANGTLTAYTASGAIVNPGLFGGSGTTVTQTVLQASGNNQSWGIFTNGTLNNMSTLNTILNTDVSVGTQVALPSGGTVNSQCFAALTAATAAINVLNFGQRTEPAGVILAYWNLAADTSPDPGNTITTGKIRNLGNTFYGYFPSPPKKLPRPKPIHGHPHSM